ncbi:STAS domain-containing protein [Fictibacillus phosphorivorans]|uniref:STAS domain-containing protein n=1 Tax=Fictibacillus phosphorivorans TaxID=1221500 RepID=UPI002041228F|nr:STAS domain-containing protein [Fictibacillus phosphorivorans]MCM3718307.1 STAS domain-containing protein [Fictibacillus phosphorivorans]MCM3775829.1 STAS domain-containing protein [Fictibacillus phosphorivorans]
MDLHKKQKADQIEIGNKIKENAEYIAKKITKMITDNEMYVSLHKIDQKQDELEASITFIQLIGDAISEKIMDPKKTIAEWGEKVGEAAVHSGQPLNQSLENTSYYRQCIWDFIKEEGSVKSMSAETVLHISTTMNPMIDFAVQAFSKSYVNNYREIAEKFHLTLQELSVPVVPLFPGVAVLPVIGEVDTNRAKILLDTTLQQCVDNEITSLVIDLSGVSYIDTMVAHRIFQLVSSLKLLGVKTTLTGLSPEIAQTSISLDLDFEEITIKGNLLQALADYGYGKIDR